MFHIVFTSVEKMETIWIWSISPKDNKVGYLDCDH